jgi:hypothetical protein
MGKKETTSWAQIMKEEQLLLLKLVRRLARMIIGITYFTDLTVITFRGFFEECFILSELFLIGE